MAAVFPLASYAHTGHWRIQVPLVPLMILACFLSAHFAWCFAQVGHLTCQQKSILFHTPDNSNAISLAKASWIVSHLVPQICWFCSSGHRPKGICFVGFGEILLPNSMLVLPVNMKLIHYFWPRIVYQIKHINLSPKVLGPRYRANLPTTHFLRSFAATEFSPNNKMTSPNNIRLT